MKSSFKSSIFYLLWSTFSNAKSHLMTWNMFKNKKTRNQKFKQHRRGGNIQAWSVTELMLRKAEWRGLERGEGKPQVGKVPFVGALTSPTYSTNASSSSLSLKATVQVYSFFTFSYSLQMSAVQDLGKSVYFYRFENHKITQHTLCEICCT